MDQRMQTKKLRSAFRAEHTIHRQPSGRIDGSGGRRRGFLLILVVVVLAMASLAALNFSRSMLISHASSRFSNQRLQARMCVESGAQSARLFLAYPRDQRMAMGGTWNNPALFQAMNVIPDTSPERRGNFTIISPGLDEFGNFSSLRYGLQNESSKLNLMTLVQLDQLASGGNTEAAFGDGGAASEEGDAIAGLASDMTADMAPSLSTNILMALPGMTEEIADAILDFIDEDEEPRLYGAEFEDYYRELQPPYKPPNGQLNSVEQLLLVRGVTPAMLFGYDENRNGMLDQNEMTKMNMGVPPGTMPGSLPTTSADPDVTQPPPLGWAAYLTIHSQERNISSDGFERININSDDLDTLYTDLVTVLENEDWASFIVAYRMAGQPGGDGTSPILRLASMAASDSDPDGVMGAQMEMLSNAAGQDGNNLDDAQPWSADALSSFDLSQGGNVKFTQILDLFDASVTAGEGDSGTVYSSPFTSLPLDMANSTPVLMNYLTTVDAPSLPGRINIMECPQEILRGIPGLADEVVDEILEARVDGSDSPTRNFETWLAVEGFLSIDEMRALLPLLTCGGDVFKCQIIGYMEGDAAFSRVETIVSAAGELPQIQFFRRLDHLGRGFDITTLGQRFDAGMPGASGGGLPGAPASGGMAPGGVQPGGIQ